MKILLSTSNPKKLKELAAILSEDFELLLKSDMNLDDFEVEEDRDTLEGNSQKKAFELYKKANCAVIADDTGLFVEALNGEPGVFSARYAGEDGNDEKNIDKLLLNLEGVKNRKAYFETVICLITEDSKEYFAKGRLYGEILESRRGTNGFGYDKVFFLPEIGKSLAELEPEIKNSISHRKNALVELNRILKTL